MTEKAIKLDSGKPRLGLFPTEAILAGGRALTYGVDKYADYNYKQGEGLDWNRYYDALLRHLFAWIGGEENDKESKLCHLDHVMACAAMLTDAVGSGIGKDTRFKRQPYKSWLLDEPETSQTWNIFDYNQAAVITGDKK